MPNVARARLMLLMFMLLGTLAVVDGAGIGTDEIMNAISMDDMARLREAVERFPDGLSGRNWDGASALESAVFLGRTEMVKYLVGLGCPVDAPCGGGATPLLNTAALQGDHEVMSFLIGKGAGVNASTPLGITPLHCAVGSYDLKMVRLLVDAKAILEAREFCLGWTPLHQAVSGRALTGAPKGSRDDLPGIVRVLADAGADLNSLTWDGKTALQLAEESSADDVAAFLRSKGVAEKGSAEFPTQMIPAVSAGDLATVRKLLERFPEGRNLRYLDSSAYPPVTYNLVAYAIHVKSLPMLKLFLDLQVNVHAVHPDYDGCQPIQIAARRGNPEMVTLLLEHGADINARDSRGRTAMHYAVYEKSSEVVQLLLAKGAEVNPVDANRQTPFIAAGGEDGGALAKILKAHGGTEAPPEAIKPRQKDEVCSPDALKAMRQQLVEAMKRGDTDAVLKLTLASDVSRIAPLIKEVAPHLPLMADYVQAAGLMLRGGSSFYSVVVDEAGRYGKKHDRTLFDLIPQRNPSGEWCFSGIERGCLFMKARAQIRSFIETLATDIQAGDTDRMLQHFVPEEREGLRAELEPAKPDFKGIAGILKSANVRHWTEKAEGREGTAEIAILRGKAVLTLSLVKTDGTWFVSSTGGLFRFGMEMRALNKVLSRLADILKRGAFDEAAELFDPEVFPAARESWQKNTAAIPAFCDLLRKATPTILGVSDPESGYAGFELTGISPMTISLKSENGVWRINQISSLADVSDEPARVQKLIDRMIQALKKKDPQAAQECMVPLSRGEYFLLFKQNPEIMPKLAESLSGATIKDLGSAQTTSGPLPMTTRRGEIEIPTVDGKTRMPVSILKFNDEWFFERF